MACKSTHLNLRCGKQDRITMVHGTVDSVRNTAHRVSAHQIEPFLKHIFSQGKITFANNQILKTFFYS